MRISLPHGMRWLAKAGRLLISSIWRWKQPRVDQGIFRPIIFNYILRNSYWILPLRVQKGFRFNIFKEISVGLVYNCCKSRYCEKFVQTVSKSPCSPCACAKMAITWQIISERYKNCYITLSTGRGCMFIHIIVYNIHSSTKIRVSLWYVMFY